MKHKVTIAPLAAIVGIPASIATVNMWLDGGPPAEVQVDTTISDDTSIVVNVTNEIHNGKARSLGPTRSVENESELPVGANVGSGVSEGREAATPILIGISVAEIREANAVRRMFESEHGQTLIHNGKARSLGPTRSVENESELPVGANVGSGVSEGREAATPILIGISVAEIREANAVRRMFESEHGQTLDRIGGVFGFVRSIALFRTIENPAAHNRIFLNREPFFRSTIELHKTSEGRVTILMYVDEASAARLGRSEGMGEVLGYFTRGEGHPVLVAVPTSRVREWQHRVGAEFAAVDIN